LRSRFLVNATKEDYTEQRILLVIEIAHWYYIDYFQKQNPDLKPMTFPNFSRRMFQEYPPLRPFIPKFQSMLDAMKRYKRNIPVFGGVILNPQMNRILLVRGVKNSDGFSFPRGKINSGESQLACAAREIYEEAGLSVEHLLDANEYVSQDARKSALGQFVTLFFVVVEEAGMVTKPTVLNEIGAIQWHSISRLIKEGNRSYLLPHFLPLIETWVKRKNPNYVPAANHGRVVYDMKNPNAAFEEPTPTEPSTISSFYFDRSRLLSCFSSPSDQASSSGSS
jgi:mRNA-decapping enzyme subunit 2